jgi:hypothetical protein
MKDLRMAGPERLDQLIKTLDERAVTIPANQFVISEFGFLARAETNSLLEQITLWRRAIVLSNLFSKSKEDPGLSPFFETFLQRIMLDVSDAEKLAFAIRQVAMLPQLEWSAAFLERMNLENGYLDCLLKIQIEMSSASKWIKDFLDQVFGRFVRATETNYEEEAYLVANPEIVDAIARGQFSSGKEHFLHWGINEDRKLKFVGNFELLAGP